MWLTGSLHSLWHFAIELFLIGDMRAGSSVFRRVGFERFQIHKFQHGNVAGCQHDGAGVAGFERLRPTPHADAPAVAFRQAVEIVFGARRDEVVALQFQKFEKGLGDMTANGMQSVIPRPRAAIAIAIKPGHGRLAAAW